MDVKKVRELIRKTEEEKNRDYILITRNFDFLMKERIKLVENQMRENVGLTLKEIDKEGIMASIREINEIALKHGSEIHINEDWENIEAFLRMSLLDDISTEFEKQKR